jgi:hypothetical protein
LAILESHLFIFLLEILICFVNNQRIVNLPTPQTNHTFQTKFGIINGQKILRKDSGRRVFGFPGSPDIPAKIKILAGKLNDPIYALAEHMLQFSAGLIAQISENPEENALLRTHLSEIHVGARAVEKIGQYDEDMGKRLEMERRRHFEEDKEARQIVYLIRNGLKPNQIIWLLIMACVVEWRMQPAVPYQKTGLLTPDYIPDSVRLRFRIERVLKKSCLSRIY